MTGRPIRWVLRVIAALLIGIPSAIATPAGAQVGPTKILDRVRLDGRKSIDFHAAAFPETLYVGQQVTYQVAVFLNADARARLRRNPEFLPPELRGLLAYELGKPTRVAPSAIAGGVYEAHVFQRAMFPVAAGPLSVPAPQLTYALPQSSSYFSREERFVVRAESAQLVVRAIPTEGRPQNYSGAVGVFTATSRLDTAAARVGDPLVFTLRVQGIGNVKLLPRPPLEIAWASAVPATERVRVDTSGPLVRGVKEFDWILTPSRQGRVEIPVMRYSYFDPYLAKFADAEAATFGLDVRPGVLVTSEEGESTSLLPLRDPGASASALRSLLSDTGALPIGALVLCLLAPLPAIALGVRRGLTVRRVSRTPKSLDPRQRLLQLFGGGADASMDVRTVRRTMHTALADRLRVEPNEFVAQRQIRRALRRRGVTRETTERVVSFLDDLDAVAFSPTPKSVADASAPPTATSLQQSPSTWTRLGSQLYAAVDSEAVKSGGSLPPDRLSMHIGLALLLLALSTNAPALSAQTPKRSGDIGIAFARPAGSTASSAGDTNAATVARATDAYQQRMFTQATELFGNLARRNPNDPDALSNWGTAAWAAGDTVQAVIGWQRAARLDPLDASLQERLALLPSGARGGLADVPLVPVPMLFAVAVGAWLLGWLLLAVHLHRGYTSPPPQHLPLKFAAIALMAVGVGAGVAAWWGRNTLSPAGLAVVMRPETLHVAPGSDADAMGGVTTGDVVRVVDARDGWERVRHADGRLGWLPEDRVAALLDSTPSR